MLPLIKEIPRLKRQLSQKRTSCLLFNLDEIKKIQVGLPGFLDQLRSISRPPVIYTGIISRNSQTILLPELPNTIIIAGSNGFEIDGPCFSWKFPQLGMIYHQLEHFQNILALEIGPGWAKTNVCLNGVELTITIQTGDEYRQEALMSIIRRELSDTHLQAERLPEMIRIYPAKQWDKRLFISKIVSLLPHSEGFGPIMFYFGADFSDEAAFREVNLHGYSVLLRENIGRKTGAQYYLRNNQELNRLLIWFNSL